MRAEPLDLTIAIPFVAGSAYLRHAVRSAVEQSMPARRVLVCDNSASAHERAAARDVVAEFGTSDVRSLSFETHLSAYANWNRCMDAVDTEFVTLLHSDDALAPDYTRVIASLVGERPDAAAYFTFARVMDEHGRRTFSAVDAVKRLLAPVRGRRILLHGQAGIRALACGNFIMCPTVCYQRSALRGQRWSEDFRQVGDFDLWTRLLFAGATIVGTVDAPFRYRRHAQQTTSQNNKTLYRYREELAIHELTARRAEQCGWRGTAYLLRRAIPTRGLLAYETVRDLASLRFSEAGAKLRLLRASPETALHAIAEEARVIGVG